MRRRGMRPRGAQVGLRGKAKQLSHNTRSVQERCFAACDDCEQTLYVCSWVAYVGGGYEVINSALKPGSGEMLAETAVRLLHDVASEASGMKRLGVAIMQGEACDDQPT